MSDIWLPRIICGGLITISLASIVANYFCPSQSNTLLMIASNVVSGLLGYVTATVTTKDRT